MRLLELRPLVLLTLVLSLVFGISVEAQAPGYNIGRTPTPDEIQAWDIAIGPDGAELPKGSGNANTGAQLYLEKGCAGCHGPTGTGGMAPRLVKNDVGPNADPWNYGRVLPVRSPYATTVWDFINRGMPLGAEGTLAPDEVYALTAYLFFINELIDEYTVLDETTLPQMQMPNRDNWVRVPDWFPGQPRLQGYPY